MRRMLLVSLTTLVLACTHQLRVKNLEEYATPLQLGTGISHPTVAITPFEGRPEELWFFNAIVQRLSQDPGMGEVRTGFIPRLAARTGFEPDGILTIKPHVTYRSSGWNFLINWPGFLIFTPSWNGYVYRADIMTTFVLRDGDGAALDQFDVPVSYNIRHADMDRTMWTGLTWLEVSALAFFGGIYNANVFDRDVIPPLRPQIKDNYTTFVLAQAQRRLQAAFSGGQRAVRAGPPSESAEVFGTCFAVTPNGHLLTSYHLVKDARQVRVRFLEGGWIPAEVDQVGIANDLAVLKIGTGTPNYLGLTETRSAQIGEQVFTVGFPASTLLGNEPKFTEGSISALSGPGGAASFMQMSVPIQPGNSGGPLLNFRGEVVGVVTATAAVVAFLRETGSLPQNVNWAVKADFARPLFDAPDAQPPLRQRGDAINRAKRALCQVEAQP